MFGDAVANATNPRGYCADFGEAQQFLETHIDNWLKRGLDVWAISLNEAPDEVIGFGGLGMRVFEGGVRLNLGYGLINAAWGRGLGKELAAASVEVARQHRLADTLWARVASDNTSSRKILEAIGMQRDASPESDSEILYSLSLCLASCPAPRTIRD